ncbi:MAG: tetratricopeptide repeat protein [Methanotrichaceae archaeon]|nr:tetratricopeptide repeat protein [Methanotrichaceae archaeon]
MVCFHELSAPLATEQILNSAFVLPISQATNFFISLFPKNGLVYMAAIQRLHCEGYRSEAWSLVKKGLQEAESADNILIQASAMCGIEGKPKEGLEFLDKISDPNIERYYTIKGNLLKSIDEREEAAKCWEKAIEIDPTDSMPMNNLGYYYSKNHDYKKAEQVYRSGIAAMPNLAHFYAHLVDALYFQDRYHEAMNCYSHAMQMPDEAFESYDATSMRDNIEQMMSAWSSRIENAGGR